MRPTLWTTILCLIAPAWAAAQTSQPQAPSSRTVPTVAFPLRHAYTRLHPDRVAVLEPRFDVSPASALNVLVVYSGSAIMLFDPVENRELWPKPIPCANEPALLAIDDERLILATATQIFCVARSDGRTVWRVGEKTSTVPDDDPEWQTAWIDHVLVGDRLFSANDRHEVVCVNARDGAIVWRKVSGPQNPGQLAADARWIVAYTEDANSGTLTGMSAETGAKITSAHFDFGGTLQSIQMTESSRVLAVSSTEIVAIDAATLKVAWRIPGRPVIFSATLLIDPPDLFVSDDGSSLTRFSGATGEKRWRTKRLANRNENVLWTASAGSRVLAASPKTLRVFDAADGHRVWGASGKGLMNEESPVVIQDAILTYERLAPMTRPTTSQPMDIRLKLKKMRLIDGACPDSPASTFTTEPLESFGGLFVRDHAVIVLDGRRLIGYVDASTNKLP